MTERGYSEGSEEIIVLVGVTFPSYQEKNWVSAKNKSKKYYIWNSEDSLGPITFLAANKYHSNKNKAIKDSDPFGIKVWDSSHCKESCFTDLKTR